MLEDFFEDFRMMDKTSVPDGLGGVSPAYRDGAAFKAGISTNSSNEAQIAGKTGVKAIFTIVTRKTVTLNQSDRVKREKDGRVYRITSSAQDMATPVKALNQYQQVTAEVIEA